MHLAVHHISKFSKKLEEFLIIYNVVSNLRGRQMTLSVVILASSRPLADGEKLKRKGYVIEYNLYFEQIENYFYK